MGRPVGTYSSFFLKIRRPPRSTRTDTLFPYTTLFQSPVSVPLLEVSPPVAGNLPQSRALARALDGKLRDGLRRFDMVDLLSAKAPGSAAARTGDYRLETSLVRPVDGDTDRSEKRRVGQACVSPFGSRWWPHH